MGVGSIVFEPLLFLVGRGAKDTMIVQIIGNPALIHTRQKHGKNAFDYFGGLRVNQQGVLIAGSFTYPYGAYEPINSPLRRFISNT